MEMPSAAPWADALRAAPEAVRPLELRFLDPAAREALRRRWLELWNQIPYGDAFHAGCRARLERCVPIATGVERKRRLSGAPSQLTVVFDPAEPEAAFASLGEALPSLAWPRAAPTPQRLAASLAPYLAEPTPIMELPRVYRMVKPLPIEGREVIERSIEALELWIDDASWASAFDDDPWPQDLSKTGMVQRVGLRREAFQEDTRRFPSISYRTLWSRSVLRIESHPFGLWVFELRYRPANDARAVGLLGEVMGCRLPEDLPLDLAASLLRGPGAGRAEILQSLERTDQQANEIAMLAAVDPGESTTFRALAKWAERFAQDTGSLGAIADVASRYLHDRFLFELSLQSTEPFKSQLLEFLRPKSARADANDTDS